MELDNFRNLPAGQSKINIPPPRRKRWGTTCSLEGIKSSAQIRAGIIRLFMNKATALRQ